jgi:hypothetical protein
MAVHDIYLRCRPLQSLCDDNTATTSPDEQSESKTSEILQQPVLGHWQLECHNKIYEIGRKGPAWNPFNPLTFHSGRVTEDAAMFYREKIGRTTKSDEDIVQEGKWETECIFTATDILIVGRDMVEYCNYGILLSNCQTTVKRLAEAIIDSNDIDRAFKWPWRAAHVATILAASSVAVVAAICLWPAQGIITVTAGGRTLVCNADWAYADKLCSAIKEWCATGAATNFRWVSGDEILHAMPIWQLSGQWFYRKLVPLLTLGTAIGASFLAWVKNPEVLESMRRGFDKFVWWARGTWCNFVCLVGQAVSDVKNWMPGMGTTLVTVQA